MTSDEAFVYLLFRGWFISYGFRSQTLLLLPYDVVFDFYIHDGLEQPSTFDWRNKHSTVTITNENMSFVGQFGLQQLQYHQGDCIPCKFAIQDM